MELGRALRQPFWYSRKNASDRSARYPVDLGQLTQAAAKLSLPGDSTLVEIERAASDMASFQARSSHAGANAFDNQTALEFRNGTNDNDDRSAQRAAAVDVFSKREELDSEAVQFIERFQKMPYGARHPVEPRDRDHIETMPRCVDHQLIQRRTARSGTGNTVVDVGSRYLPATLLRQLAQIVHSATGHGTSPAPGVLGSKTANDENNQHNYDNCS